MLIFPSILLSNEAINIILFKKKGFEHRNDKIIIFGSVVHVYYADCIPRVRI